MRKNRYKKMKRWWEKNYIRILSRVGTLLFLNLWDSDTVDNWYSMFPNIREFFILIKQIL